MGHSIGGVYADHFCKMYPKRCKKMILIESVYLKANMGGGFMKNNRKDNAMGIEDRHEIF